jgi:5-methylcytosine-specific restriction endonuclease McrA
MSVPKADRMRVRLRDGGCCHYCGIVVIDASEVTEAIAFGCSDEHVSWLRSCVAQVDHVVPRIAGGSDEPGNLVLACRRCNGRKHAMDYRVFAMSDHWTGESTREGVRP